MGRGLGLRLGLRLGLGWSHSQLKLSSLVKTTVVVVEVAGIHPLV